MSMKVKSKIVLLANLCATIPIIMILVFTFFKKDDASEKSKVALQELVDANLSQMAKDAYSLCNTSNGYIKRQLEKSIIVAEEIVNKRGGLKLSA